MIMMVRVASWKERRLLWRCVRQFWMIITTAVVFGWLSCPSNAFVVRMRMMKLNCLHNTQLSSSADTPPQQLGSVFDELSQKVIATIGLQTTDFTESYGVKTWESPFASGTAEWLTETSPKYLTGVSLLSTQRQKEDNNKNSKHDEWTINIWMGPSYDVPHMLLTFGCDYDDDASDSDDVAPASCSLLADYVARGATPLGSDGQYLDTFYGMDVQEAWTKAYSTAATTVVPSAPSPAWTSRLLTNPIARIHVHGLDLDTTMELARGHVDRFLSWLAEAQPIAARLRGSFNLRDDKLRQYYFRGQVQEQVALLGLELGKNVAAANTGPTAEAYVGGGS